MENETLTETVSEPLFSSGCLECGKVFQGATQKSADNATRMHNTRVHTAAGRSGYKWARRKRISYAGMTAEEKLEQQKAKKREHNRHMRERYYKQGRNSRGDMMPPGWKPRGKQRNRRKIDATAEEKLEKNRAYKRQWYAKHGRGKQHARYIERKNERKRIEPIVYHKPAQQENGIQPETTNTTINYCPRCGEHLENWKKS